MSGDRLSEAFARQYSGGEFGGCRAHAADVGVGRKQFQRVVDARAGAQQQGEIGGEHRHLLSARP